MSTFKGDSYAYREKTCSFHADFQLTAFLPCARASAETPQHVVKQPAGGYSVQVGDVLVTSFTDGTVAQDLHKLLRRTTPQNIDALLAKTFRPTRLRSPSTRF